MRKIRIREEQHFNKDGEFTHSTFYTEKRIKLLWLIPIWIQYNDNPYTSYDTYDKAKAAIQADIEIRHQATKTVQDITYDLCIVDKTNVVECKSYKHDTNPKT